MQPSTTTDPLILVSKLDYGISRFVSVPRMNVVVTVAWRAQRPHAPNTIHYHQSYPLYNSELKRNTVISSSPPAPRRPTRRRTRLGKNTIFSETSENRGAGNSKKKRERKKRNPLWSDRVRTRLAIGSLPLRNERKSSRPPTGKTRTTRAHLTDGEERGRRTSRPPHTDSAKARNQIRK